MSKNVQTLRFAAAVAFAGAAAMPAWAVDGVILIDQNKATAGSVTPGDAPGFPVSINQPGSYKLTGDLTVPDANTTAIEINASHVTLDLNGFAILGPTDCSGNLNPCANAGSGHGITTFHGDNVTPAFNITIRNGTVQGMGGAGIYLRGDSHLVEYVHARSNGGGGISIRDSDDHGSSIVQHCNAQRNGGSLTSGISVGRGLVTHNTADVNTSGITMSTGTAAYNVVTRNATFGMFLDAIIPGQGGAYFGNSVSGNGLQDVLPIGGWVNAGQNVCGTVLCP